MRTFLTILAIIVSGAGGCYIAWCAFSTLSWALEQAAATHLDVRLDVFMMLVLMVYIFGRVRRK